MFNTDALGNTYFSAGIAAGNYPITTTTPTHVLVAGAGGIISRVAVSQLITTTQSSSPVTSVFGRTGHIMPSRDDYSSSFVKEGSNLYFTNARSRAAISLTTVGSTGPATYDSVTGIINVPQYQNDFNGVNSFNTRTGAVTLTALDVTTALTYTPIAIETDPVWTAQKSLYYTKVESDAAFAASIPSARAFAASKSASDNLLSQPPRFDEHLTTTLQMSGAPFPIPKPSESRIFAVAMAITLPVESNTGPPEFPGLMGAVNVT